MHLIISGTCAFLCEILKQFCITLSCCGNTCFKIFSEFIINYIKSAVAMFLNSCTYIFIDIYNIKTYKRIKDTSGGETRIKSNKILICFSIIVFEILYKFINVIYFFFKCVVCVRIIIFPVFNCIHSSLKMRIRHDTL